jgi:hypothetical protein
MRPFLRIPSPPVAALPLLLLSLTVTVGRGETRSDPQTEGEKRLLEWDTTKSFKPSKSAFNGVTAKGTSYVPVSSFGTRSFVPKNSVSTSSFYTPEFLSSPAGAAQKTFNSGPAFTTRTDAIESTFNTGKNAVEPKAFSGSGKTARTPDSAPDAGRPYLGPEAAKMKEKYTPATAPKGGVVTGHQLSIEEVRDILNRNK